MSYANGNIHFQCEKLMLSSHMSLEEQGVADPNLIMYCLYIYTDA